MCEIDAPAYRDPGGEEIVGFSLIRRRIAPTLETGPGPCYLTKAQPSPTTPY